MVIADRYHFFLPYNLRRHNERKNQLRTLSRKRVSEDEFHGFPPKLARNSGVCFGSLVGDLHGLGVL